MLGLVTSLVLPPLCVRGAYSLLALIWNGLVGGYAFGFRCAQPVWPLLLIGPLLLGWLALRFGMRRGQGFGQLFFVLSLPACFLRLLSCLRAMPIPFLGTVYLRGVR